jgi:hypothetical protein
LRKVLALAGVTLLLAGCGGSPQKDVESVQSLAAEGSLLAQQSAHDDVTQVFVRVHGRYLEQEAAKLARSLTADHRPRAARIAASVARDLHVLRHRPDAAARLSADLDRLARQAEELAT